MVASAEKREAKLMGSLQQPPGVSPPLTEPSSAASPAKSSFASAHLQASRPAPGDQTPASQEPAEVHALAVVSPSSLLDGQDESSSIEHAEQHKLAAVQTHRNAGSSAGSKPKPKLAAPQTQTRSSSSLRSHKAALKSSATAPSVPKRTSGKKPARALPAVIVSQGAQTSGAQSPATRPKKTSTGGTSSKTYSQRHLQRQAPAPSQQHASRGLPCPAAAPKAPDTDLDLSAATRPVARTSTYPHSSRHPASQHTAGANEPVAGALKPTAPLLRDLEPSEPNRSHQYIAQWLQHNDLPGPTDCKRPGEPTQMAPVNAGAAASASPAGPDSHGNQITQMSKYTEGIRSQLGPNCRQTTAGDRAAAVNPVAPLQAVDDSRLVPVYDLAAAETRYMGAANASKPPSYPPDPSHAATAHSQRDLDATAGSIAARIIERQRSSHHLMHHSDTSVSGMHLSQQAVADPSAGPQQGIDHGAAPGSPITTCIKEAAHDMPCDDHDHLSSSNAAVAASPFTAVLLETCAEMEAFIQVRWLTASCHTILAS